MNPTIKYIFDNKMPELNSLIAKYGIAPANSKQDLWEKTNFCIRRFRERFMKDLCDIHPDKDLFEWRMSLDKEMPSEKELMSIMENTTILPDTKSNCNGNTKCATCSQKSNADGSSCMACENSNYGITGAEIQEKIKNNMPVVVIASLALVIGVIALTK